MELKKQAFIKAYIAELGNIKDSCEATKISRQTYYNWIEKDSKFKAALENISIEDIKLDFAESKLFEFMKNESKAVFYYLNNKGKSRGYGHPKQFEAKVLIEPITGIKVE